MEHNLDNNTEEAGPSNTSVPSIEAEPAPTQADDDLYEEPDDLITFPHLDRSYSPPRTPSPSPAPRSEQKVTEKSARTKNAESDVWETMAQNIRPPNPLAPDSLASQSPPTSPQQDQEQHSEHENTNPSPFVLPPTPTSSTPSPSPSPKHLKIALKLTLASTLLPAHIYIAYSLSPLFLLRAYTFAFVILLYFIASCVLVLGILVPPVMLVHWVWEVWCEERERREKGEEAEKTEAERLNDGDGVDDGGLAGPIAVFDDEDGDGNNGLGQ